MPDVTRPAHLLPSAHKKPYIYWPTKDEVCFLFLLEGCVFFLLLVPMEGLPGGTNEVLTSLAHCPFFFFVTVLYFPVKTINSSSTSQLPLELSCQECAIYCNVWSATIQEPIYTRL